MAFNLFLRLPMNCTAKVQILLHPAFRLSWEQLSAVLCINISSFHRHIKRSTCVKSNQEFTE